MASSTEEGVRRLRCRGLGTAAAVALACAAPARAHAAITVPDDFAVTRVADVTIPTALAFGPQDQLLVATKAGRVLSLARGCGRAAPDPRPPAEGVPRGRTRPRRPRRRSRVLAAPLRLRVLHPARADLRREGGEPARAVRGAARRHRGRPERTRAARPHPVALALPRRRRRAVRPRWTSLRLHRRRDVPLHGPPAPYAPRRMPRAERQAQLRGARGQRAAGQDPAPRSARARPGRERRRRALRPDRLDEPGRRCREIFARGLRNPFRMAFDPAARGTRFFINDVGEQDWEEINVGKRGANYGWNVREGRCPAGRATGCGPAPRGLTDPLYTYHQSSDRSGDPGSRGCEAITGGAFVPALAGPARTAATTSSPTTSAARSCGCSATAVACGRASSSAGSGGAARSTSFGPGPGGPALYFTTLGDGGASGASTTRRGTGSPRPRSSPSRHSASSRCRRRSTRARARIPTGTRSSSSGRSATAIRGDRAIRSRGTATSSRVSAPPGCGCAMPKVRHPRRSRSASIPATHRPRWHIAGPRRYGLGRRLTLRASVFDAQDGALDPDSVTWRILLHHETHTHPYADAHGAVVRAARAPHHLGDHDPRTTFLRVHATASDSWGLTGATAHTMRPRLGP